MNLSNLKAELRNHKTAVIILIVILSASGLFVIHNSGRSYGDEHEALKPKGAGSKPVNNRATIHAEARNPGVGKRKEPDLPVVARAISIVGFEVADFDAAWAEAIRAGRTEQDQVYNLSLVVGRMSRIGDPEQVLTKIHGQFGPGRSRCHLIGTLFMGADDIDGFKQAFTKLEFPDEISAACAGISHSSGIVSSPELIDRSKYEFLGERFNDVHQKALALYVSRFLSKPTDELTSAITRAVSSQSTGESKRELLSKLAKIAPFETWEQLASNKLELPATEQNYLLAQMFGRDARRSIERIAKTPNSEKHFPSAIQLWLEKDARAPIEWLESNNQNLSQVQRECAMQGIAEYSVRQGDSVTAWKWVKQITDSELHKAAEAQVWSMERDMVHQEVEKNPEATVQAMVTGDSQHADYWLEEAMTKWMAKDPEKARSWYQANWNAMPANKSQFLAAALANQAINQGDAATAREWAAHIQDAKTKQRIESGIAKTEGHKGP